MGAILCVCDCITDRGGPGIPNRAVSKQLTDQIKAVSVLARTNLVMVMLPVQGWAALSAIHGFHTCYRSRYLSNEFADLKETILLLFCKSESLYASAARKGLPCFIRLSAVSG